MSHGGDRENLRTAALLLLPMPHSPETYYGVSAATSSIDVFHEPYILESPAYVLLPVYTRRRHRPRGCGCFRCFGSMISSSTFLFGAFLVVGLLAAAFFLWPSEPELTVARFRLDHFHVTARPEADFDISMAVELRILKPAFFALDYRSIVVSIGFRGRQLGSVAAREVVLGHEGSLSATPISSSTGCLFD